MTTDPRDEEIKMLRAAITTVLTQTGDDICWGDAYQYLGEIVGIKFDPTLIPRDVFRSNCQRYEAAVYEGTEYAKCPLTERIKELERCKRIVDAMELKSHEDTI